ncbi:MAG: glycosyltransferase family 4 protein [Actinomycetota bacterium]
MIEKSLKFCLVTTFYPPYNFGGDGIFVHRLANALARRGHSVDVFHCEDAFLTLNKQQPTADFPNHPNVKVHRLKSGKGFLSPLLTQQTGVPFFKSELKNALETNDYDVIHYHNISLIGITALSYGKAVKLYTTHEHWLICPMHVLWKFDREVCTKKSCLSCQLAGKRPPQLWRLTGLLKSMLKYVDCFIAPSRFTLRKHLEDGLEIPIKHLPHFLPLPKETGNSAAKKTSERPYFLFAGRLEQIKGVQNIIPVFQNQDQYDLLIAGDGEYRTALETQAANSARIKFLGRVDENSLQSLYESAVAVIVPSICYETFGIIVIEAFANRTPVIVNNLGALPETIEDSGGGFVYSNQSELITAMQKLASDPALRNELGEKGFQAYMKYWSEEVHLAQYFSLIEKLQEAKEKFNEKLNSKNTKNDKNTEIATVTRLDGQIRSN